MQIERADARTRTGDPFITSEVLYQLSYVGGPPSLAAPRALLDSVNACLLRPVSSIAFGAARS